MDPTLPYSLLDSFRWHLRSKGRSANTMASYLESIRQAEAFLAARGTTLIEATRADLEAFLAELLDRRAPSTAATRYKALHVLYKWLEEEEELPGPNPTAKMGPPIIPEQSVPIVPEDGLKRLLNASWEFMPHG